MTILSDKIKIGILTDKQVVIERPETTDEMTISIYIELFEENEPTAIAHHDMRPHAAKLIGQALIKLAGELQA